MHVNKRPSADLQSMRNIHYSFLQVTGMAAKFLDATSGYAIQGLNPGGNYDGIWTRDASFIIQDWFLSGKDAQGLMDSIVNIWSHQITATDITLARVEQEYDTDSKKMIVYGRGSPALNYNRTRLPSHSRKHPFEGALPTTIFEDFLEIYGQNPDIDSTALMISSTAQILTALIQDFMATETLTTQESSACDNHAKYFHSSIPYTSLIKAINDLIPHLLSAIQFLASRDIDDDGLLEQDYNEDWMDTALRAGKIVYSQACWLMALRALFSLLSMLGYSQEAEKIVQLARRTIHAVEQKLWSEKDGCYIDNLTGFSTVEAKDNDDRNNQKMITQDVCLYLVALSEYLYQDGDIQSNNKTCEINREVIAADRNQVPPLPSLQHIFRDIPLDLMHRRANRTLDAIRSRIWAKNENEWPLVTELALRKTGPTMLDKYQYHNHAFWPWITGIEMLARSRFGRPDECLSLLSIVASEEGPKDYSLYEWVDPNTFAGQGAFPFRTGISAVRLAIIDIALRHQ